MTATLIGATGLIGGYLLEELLKDGHFDTVRILVRRPFEKEHPKLEKKIVDFSDPESFRLALEGSGVVFCAVGTTQKNVKGDKAAYRKVDHDIPVNAARLCKLTGCSTLVVVSSAGASSSSINFYARLKGEMETAVKAEGLRTTHIMRPSMLLGERKEYRLGEKIGKALMTAFSFLIPAKYKAIHAKKVAEAMIAAAKKNEEGFFIHENKEMRSPGK